MTAKQEILGNEQQTLYGRMWQVLVWTGEEKALDVSDLRIVFEIKQNALGQPGIMHLVVYNLSPESEAQIIQEGFHIQLIAGYQAQYGILFGGDIIQVFRNREEGTEYKLEIIAADGKNWMGINFVKATLAAGCNPRQIVEGVAKLSYYPIEIETISESLPEQELPRGKVCWGQPNKILNDVSKGTDSFYHVSQGKLTVRKYTDPIPEDKMIVLTPVSGLVGTPEYTDDGIHIKMLLNPLVGLHSMIKIDNEIIQRQAIDLGLITGTTNLDPGSVKATDQNLKFDPDGEYEVYSYVHSGDTHGQIWTTEVVGIGRNGRAGLPVAVESAEGTVRS